MTYDDLFPAAIVGGGLAGLSAALHLAARGIPPIVLEADSLWPGGRLSGGEPDRFDYCGRTWSFMPDQGVHALWGGYDNMRAMLDRFLGTELRASEGEEWINRWGREVRRIEAGNAVRSRWVPAPFHYLQLLFNPQIWNNITPLDFLSLPGFLASILWTIGFDPIAEQKPFDGLLMKDYFRGWTPNLRATFTGLGVNLLAAPPEEIDLSAFIAALRFYTMLRRDAWRLEYLPGNAHQHLIQPMIARLEAQDGLLLRGAEAQRLERIPEGWRLLVNDNRSGATRSVAAQHVILAVEAPAAQRILMNSPDTCDAASRLVFPQALRSVVVRLWFAADPPYSAPGGMLTGDFVPDNFFWLHRLYDEFAEWHQVTGGSVIELHFYGPEAVLDQPDKNLLILAVNEAQRAFPALRGSFVYGVIRRNLRTHTRFRVPSMDSLHVRTPWPSIHACGDWVGYPAPAMWMERATVTGIAAANQVLEAQGLEAYAIIPPRQPEALARILGGIIRVLRRLLSPVLVPVFRAVIGLRRILSRRRP